MAASSSFFFFLKRLAFAFRVWRPGTAAAGLFLLSADFCSPHENKIKRLKVKRYKVKSKELKYVLVHSQNISHG